MTLSQPLSELLRDQLFEHRLAQADLISGGEHQEEREQLALAIVQEIALHQVYAKLNPEQLATLGDRFVTLVAEKDRSRIPRLLVDHLRPTDTTGQKHLFRD